MRLASPQEGTPLIPARSAPRYRGFAAVAVIAPALWRASPHRYSTITSAKRGIRCRSGRFQSVAQFVEWRLRRARRTRRRAAARASARSGTVARAIATAVRAGDDVTEVCRHFFDAEHAGDRCLRRARCSALSRRSCLIVRRGDLRGGRRRRKDECCNERELVHDRARLSHRGQPARRTVCSATAMPSARSPKQHLARRSIR